jgi:dTDP-4-dehydrorhamnose 3,5-epimerase
MNIRFEKDTILPEVLLIHHDYYEDDRGYLCETFNKDQLNVEVKQSKLASSKYGVLRGLHFHTGADSQGKIVKPIIGGIFDIAVDVRKGSKTFGKYTAHILVGNDYLWGYGCLDKPEGKMMYIPPGFAHGVLTISDRSIFQYLTTESSHNPKTEQGLKWNDPDVNIEYPIGIEDIILSEKDKNLPYLSQL